ncbi:putative T7SS-secreted protein [Streptomyces sp. NPDC005485]|uniref:CdiA C-terminal domain-containing protein n=1 Tax=Streptomyces sp. NPDC005485 TaxID=3155591 RepID=UPI0033B3DB0D
MLGEGSDPVPGDPDAIALLGQSLREVANDIQREAGDVEALCGVESWKSKAADAFRDTAKETLKPLRKAYHRYDKAASAMGTRVRQESTADWASALEHVQHLADKALKAAQVADREHQSATKGIKGLPPHTQDDDPELVRLKKKRDTAADDLGAAKSALQHAKDVRDDAADQAAKVIHRAITHDGMHDSRWDKFGNTVDSIVSDAGEILKEVGEVLVSDLASIGQAMADDLGSTMAVLGGLGLAAMGAGEEVGGILLDATGIGAALGIPINIAAAAQIATGLSIAGVGAANIMHDAAGPDRVDMTSDGSGGGTDGDWDTAARGERTRPSKDPSDDAKPGGRRTELDGSTEKRRGLTRENEAADQLAKSGYDVEQNPEVPGPKEPDYRVEGKIFDAYSPKTGNDDAVAKEVKKKVREGQADRIVLNLADTPVDPAVLRARLERRPIEGLKEILIVDKSGNVIPFYP